ncbi:Transporter permease protein [Seminavis robusta]|uniref:Transporter permease protein n=1 Tax=Seminavis robusta TaxID=568900 RepID=A0A9N8EJM9_9STRA|nr:Transporter permease protein [Seminavis robusta]|eukprot:Sro1208_g252570.1 Transporter permease protein (394) ;mRNA; r:10001-11291
MCPPLSLEKQSLLDCTVDIEAASVVTTTTMIIVALYVLSGCSQPILMTVLRQAGLADSNCQVYMLFYYLGTASAIFTLPHASQWPSKRTMAKAAGIALWDICAQTMNYTGAALTGPTIFAIIYASVTIWAAIYSQVFLGRRMNTFQWCAVILVFGGLALTANDSVETGSTGIIHGLILVVAGSSMHGLFYVMSEAVMTTGTSPQERLTVPQNCAVQGMTASACFAVWQFLYTLPHFEARLLEPMQTAGTSLLQALFLLVIFGAVSFVHSITFYHTLRHLPGGSTSAGVFKGLQAVLVFVFTHAIFCHRVGGPEMCFTQIKLFSLVTVAGGVAWYGHATSKIKQHITHTSSSTLQSKMKLRDGGSYHSIMQQETTVIEIEPIASTVDATRQPQG